jgi:hypothetical protein
MSLALTADDPAVLAFVGLPCLLFVVLCIVGFIYRRKP